MFHTKPFVKDEERTKTEKEKVRVALRNCGYPEWDMRDGEQLGKRQKRREEEVVGQGGNDRREEPKKAFVVLAYMKGVTQRLQEPIKNTTSSSFAKLGTPSEMLLYARRTLWIQTKNAVWYISASVMSVVSCMWGKWRDH